MTCTGILGIIIVLTSAVLISAYQKKETGTAKTSKSTCSIWTETRTLHVLRGDKPNQKQDVSLYSAKNEWESFQILVRSDVLIEKLTIEPSALTGPDNATISLKNAWLFRQHQIKIDTPTFRNDKFEKDWYPDPLIPFQHPISKRPLSSAVITAVPFDITPNQTVGFWVDIYIPSHAVAGKYNTTYTVKTKDSIIKKIPVSLTVWDFELPKIATFKTHFGSPTDGMRAYDNALKRLGYEVKQKEDWANIHEINSTILTRHKINTPPPINLVIPVEKPDGSFFVPKNEIDILRIFVDTYHVNAIEIPLQRNQLPRIISIFSNFEKQHDKLIAWLNCWDEVAKQLDRPFIDFYIYLFDEPNTKEEYNFIRKWGKAIKDVQSVVKVLVVEQSTPQSKKVGNLYGSVDIWCPQFSVFSAENAMKRRAQGETIWAYTAETNGRKTPWWQIDFPLLNYRVPAWTSWYYNIEGLLYWGDFCYWNKKPWEYPITWISGEEKKRTYNGDGTLAYPADKVGYNGIVESIRMKALRDAVEDYEYLSILDKMGLRKSAEKIVLSLVRSWLDWEKDPGKYEHARKNLAEIIITNKIHQTGESR